MEKCSEHNGYGYASLGIVRVAQVISPINVININVVGVIPTVRPRINKTEPIAAVLEAGKPADHPGAADAKSMIAAKIGTEAIVRYAATASGAQTESRLCALSGLFLLSALRM